MTEPNIPSTTAAHVLWHVRREGYPAGSFTTRLLELWGHADYRNAYRLAEGWPDYAAALALAATADGIARLHTIAGV